MVIETRSAEETFEFGKKLGRQALPGQIYNLLRDLILQKQSVVRLLPLSRYMKKADFHFIILMFIALVILKKWKKLVMMIIFLVRVSV